VKQADPANGAPDRVPIFGGMIALLLCFIVIQARVTRPDPEKLRQFTQAFTKSSAGAETGAYAGGAGFAAPGSKTPPEIMNSGIVHMPAEGTPQGGPASAADGENSERNRLDDLNRLASDLRALFPDDHAADGVSVKTGAALSTGRVKTGGGHVRITIPGKIAFDPGKSSIKPEIEPILGMLADELKKIPDTEIIIEGYTDTVPVNTPQYPNNWVLSSVRAINAAMFLTEKKGISPEKITAVGMGEYGQAGGDSNGRLEIVIQ